jgi:hypothetical protein
LAFEVQRAFPLSILSSLTRCRRFLCKIHTPVIMNHEFLTTRKKYGGKVKTLAGPTKLLNKTYLRYPIADRSQNQTMATVKQSVITPTSPCKSMPQRRSTSTSSSDISTSLLQTAGALPSSRLEFLLEIHLRRENIDKNGHKKEKATMQAATTANSTFSLPPPPCKSMSQMRSTLLSPFHHHPCKSMSQIRSTLQSSSMKSPSLTSLLRADDALVSSGLDWPIKKAQNAARQKRTVIIEEGLQIIDEGW